MYYQGNSHAVDAQICYLECSCSRPLNVAIDDPLISHIMNGPERCIVTENVQLCVDCEMVENIVPYFSSILMNILLIYAILTIKHKFSIHPQFLTSPWGPSNDAIKKHV